MTINRLSVLVLSAILALAAAKNETLENNYIAQISKTITDETNKAADALNAHWNKDEKTDEQSVDAFLKESKAKVYEKVKPEMLRVVKNSLGESVANPEQTDMYKVLHKLVGSYTSELTLGRARALSKNIKINGNLTTKGEDDNLSKSIASLYEAVANKNVTEDEKTQLIGKSQKQIDEFIKTSINSNNKTKSKLATRSGTYVYRRQVEKQTKSSTTVAHKLTLLLTSNMCGRQSPAVVSQMCIFCQPQCTHCLTGTGNQNKARDSSIIGESTSGGRITTTTRERETGITEIKYPPIQIVERHNPLGNINGGLITTTVRRNQIGENGITEIKYPRIQIEGSQTTSERGGAITNENFWEGRSTYGVSGGSNGLFETIGRSTGSSSNGRHGTFGGGTVDIRGTYSGPANLWSLRNPDGTFTVSRDTNVGLVEESGHGRGSCNTRTDAGSVNVNEIRSVGGGGRHFVGNGNTIGSSISNEFTRTSVSGGTSRSTGESRGLFVGDVRPGHVMTGLFGSNDNRNGLVRSATWGSSVSGGSHHVSTFGNGGGDLNAHYSGIENLLSLRKPVGESSVSGVNTVFTYGVGNTNGGR